MITAVKKKRLSEYKLYYEKHNSIIILKSSSKNIATLNYIKQCLNEKSCGILKIIHNRIFKLSLKEKNVKENESLEIKEQLAAIFTNDPIASAKILIKLKKKLKLEFVGAVDNSEYHTHEYIKQLSTALDLPTQRKLFASALLYPTTTLLSTIIKPIQLLMQTLKKHSS